MGIINKLFGSKINKQIATRAMFETLETRTFCSVTLHPGVEHFSNVGSHVVMPGHPRHSHAGTSAKSA